MCLFKAYYDKKWTLPQSIKDFIIEQATKKKRVSAQYALGLMYDLGVGEPQNDLAAYCWYKYAIGEFYLQGRGVEQNKTQAQFWYVRAARKGYASAYFNLALLSCSKEFEAPDYTHAFNWFKMAADKGLGIPQDDVQALYWYTLAARKGYSRAQRNLALIYLNKAGKHLNYDEGIRWLLIAAKNGYAPAQEKLKGLLRSKDKGQIVKQEDDANLKEFNESHETLKQTVEKIHFRHNEEMQANENEENFSIPSFYDHYFNLVCMERKALSFIEALRKKSYFIDIIDLEERFYSKISQREEHYYESYRFQGNTYLCLGQEAVEEGDKLITFLKGQDKIYEAALFSIRILEEMYKSEDKTFFGKAYKLQQSVRQGKAVNQDDFAKVLKDIKKTGFLIDHPRGESMSFKNSEEKEQLLEEFKELKHLPKKITKLFIQGTQHRNALFKEEYPFLF